MSDPNAEMEAFAAMAATTPEHDKLKPFEGTFKSEVKIWMRPGEPAVSTGTMVNEFDLDGRFLRQTYTGDPNEGPFPSFEGRGYWGYNNVTKKFEGFWIDNASTIMQSEAGEVDDSGKVWTMLGEMPNPQTGGSMKKRSVIRLEDDDHHTMEMFFDAGEGEVKSMEISYERA
ncbi:MAG: DUF1579 domain-containing protein [Thermoanaerobaculia bacterium]